MHNLHRIIEFRGRAEDYYEGQDPWCYGDLDTSDVYVGINVGRAASTPVEAETVGQYVGIEDVTGKRLYEGDVVKMDWGTGSDTGVLVFHSRRCAFRLVNEWCNSNIQRTELDDIVYTLIGNIFDDPGLKKQYYEIYKKALAYNV